jgi:hypothetical protein
MAKQGGLGMSLAVDDAAGTARTISNDIVSLKFATPRDVWEVTGLDKSAMERLLLLADMTVELDGVFNPTTNAGHTVFSTVPSTSVLRTVTITVGGKVLAGEMLFTDYAIERDDSGQLTYKAPGVLGDGTVPTWA